MTEPFVYHKAVTGAEFTGRIAESNALAELLAGGENVCIYEAPRSGKHSLICQALTKLGGKAGDYASAELSMMSLRNSKDFAAAFGSAVVNAYCHAAPDCREAVETLLSGTHFVFDPDRYGRCGDSVSAAWELEDSDFEALFRLPYRIAGTASRRAVVILDDFDSILHLDDAEKLISIMEKVLGEEAGGGASGYCRASYLFVGSRINAMHGIFGVRKRFFRLYKRLRLSKLSLNEVIDHINMFYRASGKVMDNDLVTDIYRRFRGNIFYIKLTCSICDGLTKGYVVAGTVRSAQERMISIYEPHFKAIMHDLTNFQISLLKAVLDGHSKFAIAEVIEGYGLNSSANVKRLKDALCKKEVISFDDDGRPYVIDPLFEYWARTVFFKI